MYTGCVNVEMAVSKNTGTQCMDGSMQARQSIILKYIKHFQKMYRDVGMAMPKTTETRCRDGSVQARHVIQRLHN